MAVFELRFVALYFWYFVRLSATEPPICQDSRIFMAHVDHEWHVKCPPTEVCNLELVEYKIKKDPQAKGDEWKFDEMSTCYLCAPTCCSSIDSNILNFASWYDNVCTRYLLSYGFDTSSMNVWNRSDDEEMTYVVLKKQTREAVYLRLPGHKTCVYIVNNHKFVKKSCYIVQADLFSAAICPHGMVSNGMCTEPKKIGQ
ncbi:hypothetical protein EVAR_66049_1 [Eumeta japonica]|uniref:Uncharacterized protein n=1 Tax=Eumeta variegata TaxID=151549 RepID=A0A4C2AG90_EUMVA|nr:hypothetical protein EVAR_66049_1 [Eumeta japonica]